MAEIAIDELARRIGEVTIIDVRAPSEYDGLYGAPCDPRQGHIPGARNIHVDELATLDDDAARTRVGLPTGSEVIAYCHSGARSALAVQILTRLGFHARNYTGSWHEWSRSEHPLER